MKEKEKGKTTFKCEYRGSTYDVRAVCVILVSHKDVIMIKDKCGTLEFPGGKVESPDNNVFDTIGREIWEEVFLKDDYKGEFLENWPEIRKEMPQMESLDTQCWMEIMRRLVDSRTFIKKAGPKLKTMYFTTRIPRRIATYLSEKHDACEISIKSLYDGSERIRNREIMCMPRL
jgi:hypothetical protein